MGPLLHKIPSIAFSKKIIWVNFKFSSLYASAASEKKSESFLIIDKNRKTSGKPFGPICVPFGPKLQSNIFPKKWFKSI